MRSVQNPWPIFLMVATGVFLATMDSSMMNVALPTIMRSFHSTLAQTEWVVLIYLLTITVSLLFWGHFADQYGKGVVYLAGMLIFTIGSLACFLSASLLQLCLFRFVQAIGAAMMMATGPALIKIFFPAEKLGMALGFVGIATSTGLMCGPVLSGMLIENYSWRAIFLATIPVSTLVFVWGSFSLYPKYALAKTGGTVRAADWPGMLLWAVVISAVVLLATFYSSIEGFQLLIFLCMLFVLVLLFIAIESRHPSPLFPLQLFKKRSFTVAIFCATLSFAVLFVVLILMPFYMDYILGFSAQNIGFVMMSVPFSVLLISPLSGILFDKFGARFLTTSGLGLVVISLFLLCRLSTSSAIWDIALRLALLGFGQALFLSPNSAAILKDVTSSQVGISSGLIATARNLGMLGGVTLGGLFFALLFNHFTGGYDLKDFQQSQAASFMAAMAITFALTSLFSLFGALVSSFRQ